MIGRWRSGPDLLESVIDAAGLAIEIARLRAEVARRLAEVEQSRARIVTAGYEERRRLERDLHDGAQQRLVAIGPALRNIQGQLPTPGAADQLDATVGELTEAIDELRELARGVRPAGLDDGSRRAARTCVAFAGPEPGRGHRRALRRTAPRRRLHRVASEALTNAAKYARASEVAERP